MFRADRGDAFNRFFDDGRICLANSAAERALRGVAHGRKFCLFAGPECEGERAAVTYSLSGGVTMNDVYPSASLADVLARLPGTTASRVPDLLSWNWFPTRQRMAE